VKSLIISFTACVMLCTSGCSQLSLFRRDPIGKLPSASQTRPVKEIISLWEPAEGTGMDGLPCRGFAGQVLFFAVGEDEPVMVNGGVTIYVFDDQGTPDQQAEPIDYFEFDAREWAGFLRPSPSLGASYQLFIPYSRKGAHEAKCSLRIKYTPGEGKGIHIYSKMASIILAGTKAQPTAPAAQTEVTQAAHRPSVDVEELRRIARQQLQQPQIPQQGVTTASHTVSNLELEKSRLRHHAQAMLGTADERQVRWQPENREIRPERVQAVTPASASAPAGTHPLDSGW
jgi:hypothetical protein